MNVLSQLKLFSNVLMNNSSSVFLASDSVILTMFSSDNVLTRILRLIGQLLYFVSKWMLYMVDVIYFYVMQLAGISVDTSVIDSAKTDMTFSLLLDNKDKVTQVIRNFIVIALILVIVTAVIAIIKQQATSLKDKKAKNNPTGEVMRGVAKAVVLLFLTPLIAILGIIASSVLLQSLFNATNLSDTKSLSARVFNISASAANKYRIYADKGVRIPIKYKFSEEDDEGKAIKYAVEMIGNEKFPSLEYFDVNATFFNSTFKDPVLENEEIQRGLYNSGTDAWLNDVYYKYFDTSDEYQASDNAAYAGQYKIMQTHVNEYYAMADVIAYALDTMEPLYFVTIQELLESLALIDDEIGIKKVIEAYNVRVIANDGVTPIGMDSNQRFATNVPDIIYSINNSNYKYITYTSNYKGEEYVYTHIRDAEDEMEGAKFIMAYQEEAESNTFTLDVNGDYYAEDVTKKATKYFYKDSPSSRYKTVDLFYYYDINREDYVKAPTVGNGAGGIDFNHYQNGNYYYKMGADYYQITSSNFDKFSYQDKDGVHQGLTSSTKFYTCEKKSFYLPLVGGVAVGENNAFQSDYISNLNIITARGLFDEASYPTAIRKTTSGNVMFYRDDLELVANGSVSDFGTLDQIEAESDPEEEKEDKGFFAKIGSNIKAGWNSVKSFFSGLFNPLKLVPNINLDQSAMSTTYTKKTSSVYVLNDGRLHISYFYSDELTAKLSQKLHGMNINYLFDVMQINPVTLIVGATIFMKIMVTAVFGLINRAFNLLILFLIYPVACATIPLDDTSGMTKSGAYAKWTQRYITQLFSTYGLVLGINFSFLIMPIIDEITFFTPQNLQENRVLGRIAEALSNPLLLINVGGEIFKPNFTVSCLYLNKLLRIIFQIAAFSLVAAPNGKGDDNYYGVIKTIIGTGPGALEDNPVDAVKKTLKTMSKGVAMVFTPHLVIKNTVEKSKELLKEGLESLPGSAIIKEAAERQKSFNYIRGQDESRKALIKALNDKEPKDVVEAKLKDYQSAHKKE